MKTYWIILILGLKVSLSASTVLPETYAVFVDSLLQAHHVPGGVIGIVNREGVEYLRGFGYADIESKQIMHPDSSVFRAASISKIVTAVAAMQLVDDRLIDLHEPIESMFKPFTIRKQHNDSIHLFHLLTHTAGFDRYNTDPRVRDANAVLPLEASLQRYLLPSVTPPGEVFLYSNHGMALAGLLVEKIRQQAFEKIVHQSIFERLDMHQTAFHPDFFAVKNRVTGYRWAHGMHQIVPFEYTQTLPSSMMMTTGRDLCRFLQMLLNGGQHFRGSILSAVLIDSMLTQQHSNHPGFPGMGLGFFEYEQGGQRYFGHGGSISGFHVQVDIFPNQGIGLVLAFNETRGGQKARKVIESRLFDDLDLRSRATYAPVSSIALEKKPPADAFSGVYYFGRHISWTTAQKFKVFRGGQFSVNVVNDSSLMIQGRRFVRKGADYFVKADSDSSGWKAAGFRTSQNGKRLYLIADDGATYTRIPKVMHAGFQKWVLKLGVLLMAAGLILFHTGPCGCRSYKDLAGASVMLMLLCLFGVFILARPDQSGFSLIYRIGLGCPFAAIGCLIGCAALLIRDRVSAVGLRAGLSLLVLGQGLLVYFLHTWNLLGWHFF